MARPNDILEAMSRRSRKQMVEAVTLAAGGIMSTLTQGSNTKMEDGGPYIENPLMVGQNPNIAMARYYDTVPVDQTSELDTVKYEMTRMVGTAVISDQEVDENAGEAKIVDIAEAKLSSLKLSFTARVRRLAATLNTGNNPLGFENLFPSDPTTGSLGDINLATQPLFRPSTYDFNQTLDQDNIEEAFDDILMDLSTESGDADVIFVGRNIFRMHRAAARDRAQVSLSESGFGKSLMNLGIRGTTHAGMPVVFDEYMDPDTAFFVNRKHTNVHILKKANMKVKKLMSPWNQDAQGTRYIHEWNICTWKQYRTNARVYNGA